MNGKRIVWFLFYLVMLAGAYYLWLMVDNALMDSRAVHPLEEDMESMVMRSLRKKEHLIDLQIAEMEKGEKKVDKK